MAIATRKTERVRFPDKKIKHCVVFASSEHEWIDYLTVLCWFFQKTGWFSEYRNSKRQKQWSTGQLADFLINCLARMNPCAFFGVIGKIGTGWARSAGRGINARKRWERENTWAGKLAGILGVSTGVIGTALAQQHLRNILVFLDVSTLGQPEAFIQVKEGLFDKVGDIGVDSKQFLQNWMDHFVAWVKIHNSVT